LGKLIIGGDQMVPFCEVFVHGLSGDRSDRIGVLPNLEGHVNERYHNRDCTDHLADVRKIVETHAR
jgi:hypothetical protein